MAYIDKFRIVKEDGTPIGNDAEISVSAANVFFDEGKSLSLETKLDNINTNISKIEGINETQNTNINAVQAVLNGYSGQGSVKQDVENAKFTPGTKDKKVSLGYFIAGNGKYNNGNNQMNAGNPNVLCAIGNGNPKIEEYINEFVITGEMDSQTSDGFQKGTWIRNLKVAPGGSIKFKTDYTANEDPDNEWSLAQGLKAKKIISTNGTFSTSIETPTITAPENGILNIGSCKTSSLQIGNDYKLTNTEWKAPSLACSSLTCTGDIDATGKTITAGTVKATNLDTIPVENILTSTNFNSKVKSLTPKTLTVDGMGVLKYKKMQTGTLTAKNGAAGEVLMFYHDETVREASFPFGCVLKPQGSFTYISPIIPFAQNISTTVQINDDFYKLSPCQDGEQVEITIPLGSTLFYENQKIDLYFIYL